MATAVLALAALMVPMPAHAQSEDRWWSADKGMHFGASLVITAGGHAVSSVWLDEPWQRSIAGASLGLGAGLGKELYDLSGHGDASWKDVTWDVAGVMTGAGLALLVELLWASDDKPAAAKQPRMLEVQF